MYQIILKRIFDIIFSLLLIILLSPVYLFLGILIKIKLGSPVIFKQDRPGLHEKIFRLYKFRSMTNEKDNDGNLLSDEKRLTNFGKFLRSTSLDEIPEFFNILKGDMSFVGPRPLLVEYLPYYTSEEKHRHDVRPGLTGLAQIHGRNLLSWDEKLKLDAKYAQKVSFWGDMKILFKTVGLVLRKDGINDQNEQIKESLIKVREEQK